MTELLTAAQMRAIEQAAIDSGAATGLALMERAGQGVVDAIFAQWPELAGPAPAAGVERGASPSRSPELLRTDEDGVRRAVVLCGPGNNGGDGFVVARLLHEAGWAVDVFLYGDAALLPPDARVNYARWREIGEVICRAIDPPPFIDDSISIDRCTLIIDALFGIGLSRPFKGVFALVAEARLMTTTWDMPVVAIDVPSGLCADSGRSLGTVFRSDLTVTFHRSKIGHYIAEGPSLVGQVRVVDIGLASPFARANREAPATLHGVDVASVENGFAGDLETHVSTLHDHVPTDPGDLLKSVGHKYAHGHALILAGGVGKGGAARLAARGAIRVGAGAVTVACPPAALIENAAQLNAIMLRKVADAGALAEILEDDRLNAICIGPGLGLGAREAALVETALRRGEPRLMERGGRGVVLDADALTLLARDADLFAKLHPGCILTPHAGEFARLFPDIAETLAAPATKGPAYSKVDATREAAKRAGCVVLFKGPDTVIADPEGRCSINASVYERSAPWLATAGSGDVLAGFITGLLARGFSPLQAAETGAWLHTQCALAFGPGLIAEDLPEQLPGVFRNLGVT